MITHDYAQMRKREIEKEMENPDLSVKEILRLLTEVRGIRDDMVRQVTKSRCSDHHMCEGRHA